MRIEKHQLFDAGARDRLAEVDRALDQGRRAQGQGAGKGDVFDAAAHGLGRQEEHRATLFQMRQAVCNHAIDQVGVHTERQVRTMLLDRGDRQHSDGRRRIEAGEVGAFEVGPEMGKGCWGGGRGVHGRILGHSALEVFRCSG